MPNRVESGKEVPLDNYLTDDLFGFLDVAPRDLLKVRRWGNYSGLPDIARETTLEHTLSAVYLTAVMLAIEESDPAGQHQGKLNHARLLLAAALHDIGEGVVGDVAFAVKQDPRVKQGLKEIERESSEEKFRCLPHEARVVFRDAYQVEVEDSLHGRFFNAVERVGYMANAIPRFKAGHNQYMETFENHLEPLRTLARDFVSVQVLLGAYFDWVGIQIDRARRAREARALADRVAGKTST